MNSTPPAPVPAPVLAPTLDHAPGLAERVACPAVPEPPGATWSNALRAGNELIISGMTAHPACRERAMDTHAQALECLRKIGALCDAAGATLDHVLKLTVYLTDIADKDALARARQATLNPPYPASTLVGVSALAFPEVKVEVDAVVRLDLVRTRGGAAVAEAAPQAAAPAGPRSPARQEMLAIAAAFDAGQDDAVISLSRRMAESHPEEGFSWMARGAALGRQRRHEESLQALDAAAMLNPRDAQVFFNRAQTLIELGRLDDAVASYDIAIGHQADYVEAWLHRADVLARLKRLEPALASYDEAVRLDPGLAEAWNNRGNVLSELRRTDEALASFAQALRARPGYLSALNNRGNAQHRAGRTEAAIASFDEAIGCQAEFALAHNNRGLALLEAKRIGEALESFREAVRLEPDQPLFFGHFVYAKISACEWDGLEESLGRLRQDFETRRADYTPFPMLALFDDPPLHRRAAAAYASARDFDRSGLGPIPPRPAPAKIRIGYYSADFRNHATCALMAEVLESHDRERFETYGFAFGPAVDDEMRRRVRASFDRFIDISAHTDREVARLSRELRIDIAVDLKGYTQHGRPGLFAEGCAPVQVNFLGYPGTLAVGCIHYVIADKTVIPPGNQADYAEKVVYLPDSYQPNDSGRAISARVFTRSELGLPENGFVFCCFNNNYKILPATFSGWMRILGAVPGSVLWLLEDNPAAAQNLRQQARAAGVDPGRLVFAARMTVEEHLARHRLADLFVDTFPYNAGTTASDALWTGLPVLTRSGRSFASRLAASLLHALRLPELITPSQPAFEARAIELATDPQQLAALRRRLQSSRVVATLFDGKGYARRLEKAYAAMHERQRAGQAPAPLDIEMAGPEVSAPPGPHR